MKRIAVAVSGTGSLLAAMLEQGLPIDLVLADRSCKGVNEVPKGYGIPSVLIPRTDYSPAFNRDAYTQQVIAKLREYQVDLLVMAGFMTVFSERMFQPETYQNAVTNTHPSLLPAFKGEKAVADALEFGVKWTGCTIHWATPKLDDGPILAQEVVPVIEGDTVDTLWERIKGVERTLYPQVIRQVANIAPVTRAA